MRELVRTLETCVQNSTWFHRKEPISLDNLKALYARFPIHTNDSAVVFETEARVATEHLDALVAVLRPALHPFTHSQTDRIGRGLFQLAGG